MRVTDKAIQIYLSMTADEYEQQISCFQQSMILQLDSLFYEKTVSNEA